MKNKSLNRGIIVILTLGLIISSYINYTCTEKIKNEEKKLRSLQQIEPKKETKYGYIDILKTLINEDKIVIVKIDNSIEKYLVVVDVKYTGDIEAAMDFLAQIKDKENLIGIDNIKLEYNEMEKTSSFSLSYLKNN